MGARPLRPRAAGRADGGGRGRPADAVRARSDSTSAHDAKRKGLGHMSGLSRRELLEYAGVAVLGIGLGRGVTSYVPAAGSSDGTGRLIGDGSTADTGPQPHQPVPERLEPGQTPPQFVVFSWDGAANLETGLFPRFRSLAAEYGAAMTFFLSGIYALPDEHRMLYAPPRHPVGASDITFLSTAEVVATMSEVRAAWLDGHDRADRPTRRGAAPLRLRARAHRGPHSLPAGPGGAAAHRRCAGLEVRRQLTRWRADLARPAVGPVGLPTAGCAVP